jgi:hypothetical protein
VGFKKTAITETHAAVGVDVSLTSLHQHCLEAEEQSTVRPCSVGLRVIVRTYENQY